MFDRIRNQVFEIVLSGQSGLNIQADSLAATYGLMSLSLAILPSVILSDICWQAGKIFATNLVLV